MEIDAQLQTNRHRYGRTDERTFSVALTETAELKPSAELTKSVCDAHTRLVSSLDADWNHVDLTGRGTLHLDINERRSTFPHRGSDLQLDWIVHNVLF